MGSFDTFRFLGVLEANLLALSVLLMIYMNVRKFVYKYDYEQKIYNYLIISNAVMIIVDVLRLVVDGVDGNIPYIVNILITTGMIVFTPFLPMLWTIYIDYKIFIDKKRINRNRIFIFIPFLINFIFVVFSVTGGFHGMSIFDIDEYNQYSRGQLYFIMVFSSYSYLVYSVTVLFKNRQLLDIDAYKSLRWFAIPPFIGGLLQSLIFGVKLTWISMAVSMLVIFIYVQNNLLHVDVLTGLYNRRQLDRYIKTFFDPNPKNKGKSIGGVILDLDDFKSINDNFGHDEGDRALVSVAKLLKDAFDREDYIFRYAGDEFVVLCNTGCDDDLKRRIDRLNSLVKHFNETENLPYRIGISKGYKVFNNSLVYTPSEFIKSIDTLMYDDKEYSVASCGDRRQGDRRKVVRRNSDKCKNNTDGINV